MYKKFLLVTIMLLSTIMTTTFHNTDEVKATTSNTTTPSTIQEKISEVNLQGVKYPAIGEKPETNITSDTVDVSVTNISWNTTGSIFDYNKEYSITLELTANNGKVFADDVKVSLFKDTDFIVQKENETTLKVIKKFKIIYAPAITIVQTDTILKVNDILQLSVNDKTGSNLTWISSNDSVASVDANGVVTALKEGTTTITATNAYNKQASITITVEAQDMVIPSYIQDVTIEGVQMPVVGQAPQQSIKVQTVDVQVESVQWTPSTTAFDYEQEYTITVLLKALNGKEFQDTMIVNQGVYTTEKVDATTLKVTKTFKKINAPEITMKQTDTILKVNDTLQLTVNDSTNSSLTWVSSNDNVASVDANGVVTALKEGTTTITVTNAYNQQASITITVEAQDMIIPSYIQDVTIEGVQIPVVGQAPQQSIKVQTADVQVESVQWTPSTTAFDYEQEYTITVLLKALNGKEFQDTTIVNQGVYTTEKVDATTLKVTKTFKKINAPEITMKQSDTILKVEDTLQLTVNDSTNSSLTWVSSNDNVASVDANGVVTALKEGTTTITVTNTYNKQASIKITVKAKDSVVVNPSSTLLSEVTLGSIEAPVVGEAPQQNLDVQSDNVNLVSIQWTPTSNAFTYDTEYKVVITLQANKGYIFDSTTKVNVKDLQFTVDKVEDDIMIISYTFPKTPAKLSEEIEYPILNGNNSIVVKDENNNNNSNTEVSVRVDADITLFRHVYLNGELLDPQYYTVTEGSTIITLHPDYLDTLPAGKYQLEIVFEAGYAQAQFEIKNQGDISSSTSELEEHNMLDHYLPIRPSLTTEALQDQLLFVGTQDPEEDSQKEQQPRSAVSTNIVTGDHTNNTLWIVLLLIAIVVLVGLVIIRKKRISKK